MGKIKMSKLKGLIKSGGQVIMFLSERYERQSRKFCRETWEFDYEIGMPVPKLQMTSPSLMAI